jgi:7-keto-8-aminopelargonate synthetase-like enzyme
MQELLPRDSAAGAGLAENARHVSSAIFPWIVGAEQAVIDLASALQKEGFLVPAIRYPTVAKGSARLRITVTAAHQEDHIRLLCQVIKRLSA